MKQTVIGVLHQPSIEPQLLLDLMYLYNVLVGEGLVGLIVLCIFQQNFVHIRTGILVQFVATAKDDQGDLAITQHRQLVGFLHHAKFSLIESHLKETNNNSNNKGEN